MVGNEYWVATDNAPKGTIVAISRLTSDRKKGLNSASSLKGDFVNAVVLKYAPESTLNSPALRQLVYESHCLFRRTQMQHKQVSLKMDDILVMSLEYRSVIQSALSTAQNSNDEVCSLLSSWELVWSLAETVFLKPSTSSIVVDLIVWSQLSLVRTDYVDEISKCLRPSKVVELNIELFWKQIKYFVLGGLFANASAFLESFHKLVGDKSAGKLAKILDQIDVSAIFSEETEGMLFKLQRDVHKMIESGHFSQNSEAREIAMLITGHLPTFKKIASDFSSWFELMPVYLLFCRPNASLEDLPIIAKECFEFRGSQEASDIDTVMSALFSLDPLLAIQHIAKASADWWLAAHLADLLNKANSSLMNAYGVDARQHLVMEYGTQLFNEYGMWLLGFDYLVECGSKGKARLELLFSTLQIENETMALKIISRCTLENFENIVIDLERAMALRYVATEQWSSALIWGMRTEDPKLLNIIANQVLSRCSPDVIARMSVLEELSEVTISSLSLVFLHKYYTFRKLFNSARKKAAAQCLVDLITSNQAPGKLHNQLYDDLAVILSFDRDTEQLLDRETTYRILQYLTECDLKKMSPSFGKETQADDSLTTLRLSLLNNLCKNYIN